MHISCPCRGAMVLAISMLTGCERELDWSRDDGATPVEISTSGSHQNPAWSPEGDMLLLTRFQGAYNEGPADLVLVDLDGGQPFVLVSDGSDNVNLPGSSWNHTTDRIVFSSSREPHDEIFSIASDGSTGDETQVTDRSGHMAYEPTFSPDAEWVVFESHVVDREDAGVVTRFRSDGSGDYQALTGSEDDCRQPNWSPAGDRILYQQYNDDQWDIWVMETDGSGKKQITSGPGDKTDASFSPDGQSIVYSSEAEDLDHANLFVTGLDGGETTRITSWDGYDGAPSWSPDGSSIAFESYPGDPDRADATRIYVIEAPALSR